MFFFFLPHSKFKNVNFKTANVSIKTPDSLLTLYVDRIQCHVGRSK